MCACGENNNLEVFCLGQLQGAEQLLEKLVVPAALECSSPSPKTTFM